MLLGGMTQDEARAYAEAAYTPLVLVLDVGADRELTADYWGTGGAVA